MPRRHYNAKSAKQRKGQQSKFIMAGLCAGLLMLLAVVWSLASSDEQGDLIEVDRKSHQDSQLHRVAVLSDGDESEYFKLNLLRPFLIRRDPDSDGNRRVQQHIRTQMKHLGWHLYDDSFVDSTPYGPKTFTNIVAVQNPSSLRRLTLACHFDSKYFDTFEFIGATDSAVPCAVMIDIARHLNSAFQSSRLKDTSLQLIFFDGEEAFVEWTDTDSLYGARHLAELMEKTVVKSGDRMLSQLDMMDVFILLDLIGTQSTQFKNLFPRTEQFYTQLQNIEMRLAKCGLLEPRETFQKRHSNKYFTGTKGFYSRGGVADDHLPFLQRNVPVVHLICVPFPSEWHTAADNEAALHYPTINNIGKILRVFVAEHLQLKL